MTCGFLVLLWLLGAATASVLHGPPIRISRMVAAGVRSLEHGHVWTPLTAVMFAPDLAGYIVGTVCVLLLAVPTERRLGSGRVASRWPRSAPRCSGCCWRWGWSS